MPSRPVRPSCQSRRRRPAGGADAADKPRHRQSDRAFGRRHAQDVADAAFDFIRDDERAHELLAADGLTLGECDQGRADRAGRMRDRHEVRVVVRECGGSHRIDERRVQRIEFFAAADERGGARTVEFREDAERTVDRVFLRAACCTAHPVHECAHAFVADFFRQRFVAGRHGETRERAGDGGHGLILAGKK